VSKLSLTDINNAIKYAEYWQVTNTTTTVCAMILQNNYVVIGKSACISMSDFDKTIGEQLAFNDARNKVWDLLGFLAKEKETK
jgi:hypothetical protein